MICISSLMRRDDESISRPGYKRYENWQDPKGNKDRNEQKKETFPQENNTTNTGLHYALQ